MQIREILVNLEIDRFAPALVTCAVDLARRFDAGLIGTSAAEPSLAVMGQEDPTAVGILYEQEQQDIERRLGEVEHQFRASVPPDVPLNGEASSDNPTLLSQGSHAAPI